MSNHDDGAHDEDCADDADADDDEARMKMMTIMLMMVQVMVMMLMLMPPPMLPFSLVRVTLALIFFIILWIFLKICVDRFRYFTEFLRFFKFL